MKINSPTEALDALEKLMGKRINNILSQSSNNIRDARIVKVNTNARTASVQVLGTGQIIDNVKYPKGETNVQIGDLVMLLSSDPKLQNRVKIVGVYGGADDSVATGSGSSPLTTKGDLYTYTTEDARLPVGSDGQRLEADSTESSGIKWTDDIRSWELVEEKTFGSAATTTTFSGLSGDVEYHLSYLIKNDDGSGTASQYSVRYNGDGGETDYLYQQISNGTTISGSRTINSSRFALCRPNDYTAGYFKILLTSNGTSGKVFGVAQGCYWETTDDTTQLLRCPTKNTSITGITSIQIVGSLSNSLGIGTILKLYKVTNAI